MDISCLPCVCGVWGLATLATGLFVWLVHPGIIIGLYLKLDLIFTGFSFQKLKAGKYKYHYAERGRPSTRRSSILMLHGFSANIDMYTALVKELSREIHVILLDLPGHGDSDTPHEAEELTVENLTSLVKQFVDAVGLSQQPFHLVGLSMGGAAAVVYGSMYPWDLERLTVCCPAMCTPVKTNFQNEVKQGVCKLLAKDVPGTARMLELCLYRPKKLHQNKQALKGILQKRLPRYDFHLKLFRSICKDIIDKKLEFLERASSIPVPSQVIWGKCDLLFHVSGAKKLSSYLQWCTRTDIVDECGHLIPMDKPREMARVLMDFRDSHHERRNAGQL